VGQREPSWWYAPVSQPWITRALAPLGVIYGAQVARRMRRPPAYRSSLPVICVGNFTAGGTGKTPFVRTLIGCLAQLGHTPVVLSRGYGGRMTGPHWIDLARDTAGDVGDEPLLLAGDAPVVVARDRVAGARAIESSTHGASVIVMDDGLQNPSLAKDLSFAVVDAARGLGNNRCIPAGPLRAPLAAQVPLVHAVVLNLGAGGSAERTTVGAMLERHDVLVLAARLRASGPTAWLKTQPVVAYAGIGVPERFFESLRGLGAVIEETTVFADHHIFSDADARRLLARVEGTTLQLVTTEKDAARLSGQGGALAELARQSRTLPIAFDFDAANSDALSRLIARHAPLRADQIATLIGRT
jgi:tetraacyldisaccharide 4'-kinase